MLEHVNENGTSHRPPDYCPVILSPNRMIGSEWLKVKRSKAKSVNIYKTSCSKTREARTPT